jgi:hypothetical protein
VTYDSVLGLGPPACPVGQAKPLAASAWLEVAGKGSIAVTFADQERCVPDVGPAAQREPQELTISGGTGRFVAASGSGRRKPEFIPAGPATDYWTGTLEVPGLTFDLAAPVLRGAVSKTVRAKRGASSARVTFDVTAIDRVDGAVAVSCKPASGSRFKVGQTTVRCNAIDSSANPARASFTISVKSR